MEREAKRVDRMSLDDWIDGGIGGGARQSYEDSLSKPARKHKPMTPEQRARYEQEQADSDARFQQRLIGFVLGLMPEDK